MKVEVVIQKLMSIGYQIKTEGEDIILKADSDPDRDVAILLLAELKRCKTEAVKLLKRGADATPMSAGWPADVETLIDRFLISPVPEAPFQLNSCVKVINADLFWYTLRQDIETGPRGPRARTGAIQCDLIDLKRTLQ